MVTTSYAVGPSGPVRPIIVMATSPEDADANEEILAQNRLVKLEALVQKRKNNFEYLRK